MAPAAQLTFAAASYALVWAISWWAAIGRGWGVRESAHDPTSLWMYGRRLLLVATALLGIVAVGGASPASLGWGLSPWLLAALAIGAAMARGNRGGFEVTGVTPAVLALFHTFATELYFRGYLFHELGATLGWWALPLSAAAYGLYYLTVDTVWAGGRRGRVAGVILFTVLGLVFAALYSLSGSFLGAWLAHYAAVLRWPLRGRPSLAEG
jgi:membrane protease YdiL (CAAX protease family)